MQITHFVNNRKLSYLFQNHLNRFGQFFFQEYFFALVFAKSEQNLCLALDVA